jgi:hypothetical protein
MVSIRLYGIQQHYDAHRVGMSTGTYTNVHVVPPYCPVFSDHANRSSQALAVLVEEFHTCARASIERWTSTKEHGHAGKVKPTTREALFGAVWWLVPSKEPRSEFRNASPSCRSNHVTDR